MIKAILCGASGKMGGFVAAAAEADGGIEIAAGVDKINSGEKFPIFSVFSDINVKADVIIDFSNPALLDDLLDYAVKNNTPAVIATTGYSDSQIEKIKTAAEKVPIFFSFNMCRLQQRRMTDQLLGRRIDLRHFITLFTAYFAS